MMVLPLEALAASCRNAVEAVDAEVMAVSGSLAGCMAVTNGNVPPL